MGIGNALGKVFGGGNKYHAIVSPVVGPMQQKGQSTQAYQNQLYQNYSGENQAYKDAIAAAQGQGIRNNVLDFSQADATAAQQQNVDALLKARTWQNMNFGTGGSMAQQQGLIDQILAQGRGEGPNPALNQLRMTTDQNAKQAAAMAASQRGINPALAARLASQGVAGANQNAAGQAALQSAQQQLGAQQLGGGLLGQQIGQLTQQAGMNEANQQAYAQMLAQNLQGQRAQDITQASNQGQAGLNLLTANTNTEMGRRQAELAYQNMINNAYQAMNATNAGVASQNASQNFQYGAGAMSGLSSALQGAAGMMFAEGGEVPNPFVKNVEQKKNAEFEKLRKSKETTDEEKMYMDLVDRKGVSKFAEGGMSNFLNWQQDPTAAMMGSFAQAGNAANAAGEEIGKSFRNLMSANLKERLSGLFQAKGDALAGGMSMASAPNMSNARMGLSDIFGADAIQSPMQSVAPMFSPGGKVGGKASVRGDSTENDTVPALLSPGEVIIPRSALGSPEDAHAFLDEIISKHEGPSYQNVMQAKERFHRMAHGGEMSACRYCYGGCA